MRSDSVSWSDPVNTKKLPGIVHEVKHLEQGRIGALSQLGEVQAWYVEYSAAQELSVNLTHIPPEVLSWGSNPTEENFDAARGAIMKSQGIDYLIWMLPRTAYEPNYQYSFSMLP